MLPRSASGLAAALIVALAVVAGSVATAAPASPGKGRLTQAGHRPPRQAPVPRRAEAERPVARPVVAREAVRPEPPLWWGVERGM